MRWFRKTQACLLLVLLPLLAWAIDPLPFRDAAEAERFHALAAELRCVMCQNQSLADSDAPTARDLRRQIFQMMEEGKTDDEIKTFLTERYTEFVLYRPPISNKNWLLWFAPAGIVIAGALALALVIRRHARSAATLAPADEDVW